MAKEVFDVSGYIDWQLWTYTVGDHQVVVCPNLDGVPWTFNGKPVDGVRVDAGGKSDGLAFNTAFNMVVAGYITEWCRNRRHACEMKSNDEIESPPDGASVKKFRSGDARVG